MHTIALTKRQARRFMLLKHGLLDGYKFRGSQGVCDFVKQVGCVQYDPIDVCGKNAELVFQSRVEGFTKQMLYDLLYKDRKLLDYFDKNMAIFCSEDWKYFSRTRDFYRSNGKSKEQVDTAAGEIASIIREKGAVCSKDIHFKDSVDWYWSSTSLSRAALETLYFRGDLVVHHKKGAVKYYTLAEKHIPDNILNAPNPNETEYDHMKWLVLRRIGAVGMLWNRPSDAWLGIDGLKAGVRNDIFGTLHREGKIAELSVAGVKAPLYCLAEDEPLLEQAVNDAAFLHRRELIAPLDNLLWDRKLIKEIFDFEYKWEIYTPRPERKYGYYVLPILSGERFIGRAEIVNNKKSKELEVKNIWFENGVRDKADKETLKECLGRFTVFHGCETINHGA